MRVPVFIVCTSFVFLAFGSNSIAEADDPARTLHTISSAGFLILLPLGYLLLTVSAAAKPAVEAAQAATTALVMWGLAALAYFFVGFAFQFGGLAVSNPDPDFAALALNWSPLNESFGPNWGFLGLQGWALLGESGTPAVFDLFVRHLALLGVVVVPPAFILHTHTRGWTQIAFGLLAGTLLYPPVGNWVWGSGWLANLGLNRQLGHGFVDAGLGVPFVLGGAAALAALLAFRHEAAKARETAPPASKNPTMPAASLPLLSFFGLGMVLWSWAFIAGLEHIPNTDSTALARATLNGFLATLSAIAGAGLYSRFTTTRFDGLMTARGGLAGLVLISAVAPFVPPWQAVLLGLVAGLLLALIIYLIDHRLKLRDPTAAVAVLAAFGVLSWLMVGLLADGRYGQGWNGVGPDTYLGITGQGVSGLLPGAGLAVDWPGQFYAQLLGSGAIFGWSFGLSLVLFILSSRTLSNHNDQRDEIVSPAPPSAAAPPSEPSEPVEMDTLSEDDSDEESDSPKTTSQP